jgi:RNA polymerase sigma-70 factor, ECF subfamily
MAAMKKRAEIVIINANKKFDLLGLGELSPAQLDVLIEHIGIDIDRAAADLGVDAIAPLGGKDKVLFLQIKRSNECLYSIQDYLRGYIEQLIEDIQRYLLLVAYRILRNRESAEDVVQQALMTAWITVLKQFDEQGEVRTAGMSAWLVTIVHNTAVNYCKREQRSLTAGLLETNHRVQRLPANAFEQTEAAALHAESRAELLALLATLPSQYRKVIELRYFQEFTEAEIATVLRWPLGTVKSYLSRGRALLREAAETRKIQRQEINVWNMSSPHDGLLWNLITTDSTQASNSTRGAATHNTSE